MLLRSRFTSLSSKLTRSFSTTVERARTPAIGDNNILSKLKTYKPITPGLRNRVDIDRSELWKGKPVKELTIGLRKKGGRGHKGQISTRHRGGGHKRRYRFVDFQRAVMDIPGVVQRFEYDPNRTAHLALVSYNNDEVSYILAPQALSVGDEVMSSRTMDIDIRIGNAMPLRNIPVGVTICNVEIKPGDGGALARSAGASMELLDKRMKPGYALVRMQSKEQRFLPLDCLATIGAMSNPLHMMQKLGKAGRSRHRGIRPTTRGVAMNPVDHPHGGGEGKRKGRLSCSPTGVLAKGFRTRKNRHHDLIHIDRRKVSRK